ncbi:hypothetical protein [Clostridium tagluense]|uniref:Uncharacterized protein n=1 Tax=Clostridium tagluense TaxID=360422 RepID=A0A401UTS9_9CLOT|nr:hypothetical protein [Clostridium tagluense]GCD12916.1 hypothetical protein Ctaglu_45390 [Clostridium tagluense]
MKILNRKELRQLEHRNLFSNANGDINGLYIYEENMSVDFVQTDLLGFPQHKDSRGHQGMEDFSLVKHGKELEIDLDCSSREGFYDDSRLYAVYEKGDLLKLINKLQQIYIENYTE